MADKPLFTPKLIFYSLDEPIFFFLAIIVFPILFLIGMTGSVVMFVKDRKEI